MTHQPLIDEVLKQVYQTQWDHVLEECRNLLQLFTETCQLLLHFSCVTSVHFGVHFMVQVMVQFAVPLVAGSVQGPRMHQYQPEAISQNTHKSIKTRDLAVLIPMPLQ